MYKVKNYAFYHLTTLQIQHMSTDKCVCHLYCFSYLGSGIINYSRLYIFYIFILVRFTKTFCCYVYDNPPTVKKVLACYYS